MVDFTKPSNELVIEVLMRSARCEHCGEKKRLRLVNYNPDDDSLREEMLNYEVLCEGCRVRLNRNNLTKWDKFDIIKTLNERKKQR